MITLFLRKQTYIVENQGRIWQHCKIWFFSWYRSRIRNWIQYCKHWQSIKPTVKIYNSNCMCTFFTSTFLLLIFWIQKLRPCISGISADCSGIIFDQLKFLKYHNNKKEKHTVYKNKNGVLKGFSFVPHQKYSENGASLRVFCCLFSSLSISYFIWKKKQAR